MKTKSFLMLFGSLFFLAACGGEEAKSPEGTSEETPEIAQRPAPTTIISGNSFEVVSKTGDAKMQTGNDNTLLYTVVDYTTNVDFADLPIDEFNEPKDNEQLVKVVIDVKPTYFRMLNCKKPSNSFSLLFGGEESKAFTRFSDDFKSPSEPRCLALNESQLLDVYFKIGIDADLSAAQISLYRGSSEEAAVVNLNK